MLTVLILLMACSPERKIPDHLLLDPADRASADEATFTDVKGAIEVMLRRDPLARSPRLPDLASLAAIDGADALVDFATVVRAVESGAANPDQALQQLEERARGTLAVPFARGYRLGAVQGRVAGAEGRDEALEADVLRLLTPLRKPAVDATLPVLPLAWLGNGDWKAAALTYGDRHVLLGWLDGPGIPLGPTAAALEAENYDALRGSRLGRLIVARAAGFTGPVDEGLADLRRATELELTRVAADRDKEQAAWSATRSQAAKELGAEDPVAFLLERAAERLTAAAGDDRAAGGALLAIAGARWLGTCDAEPCVGLDRVDAISAAGRWHPEIAELSQVWRVIALKSALDSMDVGKDTVIFGRALVDLTDALLGTGAGPLESSIVRRASPDAAVWLALGRAVGAESTTDWEQVRAELGKPLAREAEAARAATSAPETRTLLERIESRAR